MILSEVDDLQVYLTDKELLALVHSAEEWCSIMRDGDEESCNATQEKLDNGLGSALYKLYKGRNGQRAYKEYAKKKMNS